MSGSGIPVPAGANVNLDRDRLVAGLDLIGRTGARGTQIRYSDDEAPTVWIAVAEYGDGRQFQAAAALDVNGAQDVSAFV